MGTYYDDEIDWFPEDDYAGYDSTTLKPQRLWSENEWEAFYEELDELYAYENRWLDYEAGEQNPEGN